MPHEGKTLLAFLFVCQQYRKYFLLIGRLERRKYFFSKNGKEREGVLATSEVFLLKKLQGKGGGVAISEVFPLSWQIGEANKYFFSKIGKEREGVTISEVFLLK